MKFILFSILFAVTYNCHSQITVVKQTPKIEVGKAKKTGKLIAEMYYQVFDTDTTYTIHFRNEEYSSITDFRHFSFDDVDSTKQKLYSAIASVFDPANIKNKDYTVMLILGGDPIHISNFKFMGSTSAMIQAKRGYFFLTKKQLDNLFNK